MSSSMIDSVMVQAVYQESVFDGIKPFKGFGDYREGDIPQHTVLSMFLI
ncbi:MAG: hypothetical protein ACNI26_02505 [Terasakiella sp.]